MQVRSKLLDVNVLMAVQLMTEMARDTPNQQLLKSLHHHILFNFSIWTRSQFHIRIGKAETSQISVMCNEFFSINRTHSVRLHCCQRGQEIL